MRGGAWGLWLVTAGCGAAWPAVDRATLPTAEDLQGAPGARLADEIFVRCSTGANGPIAEVTHHFQALIASDAGGDLAHVVVPFHPGLVDVVALEGRAVGADGTEERLGEADAGDAPLDGHGLFSDRRARVLDLKRRSPGTVVEYRATVRYANPWLFPVEQHWGSRLPARHVVLDVEAPDGWEIDWIATRLGETVPFEPARSHADGRTRWRWEGRDLPALADEPLAPPLEQRATTLTLRLARWNDHGHTVEAPADARAFSAWFHELARPARGGAAARALAAQLIGATNDPAERARLLYNWVRDRISYCAIELGIGSWRPHAPDQVLDVHYGDCKDKANLLRELLDAAGVSSRLAVVNSHQGWPPRFRLPTLGNFNHAILSVDLPTGTVWLDPTSRVSAFATLPLADQESDVLPADPHGAPLARTPSSSADDNREELTLSLAIAGTALDGQLALSRTGALADALRERLLATPSGKQPRALADLVGLPATLSALELDATAPPERAGPAQVRGHATVDGALGGGATEILRVPALLGTLLPALPQAGRRWPVVLPARRRIEQRVNVTLPAGAEVTLPPTVTIARPFARYQLEWRRDQGALVVERRFELSERVFAPADYPSLKTLIDEIAVAESRAAILHTHVRASRP